MSAVGEWVAEAAVEGISHVVPTCIACTRVGRDQGKFAKLTIAGQDGEDGVTTRFDLADGNSGKFG
jgi:hypothetical protein